ncbi:MAG TPA: hypothetical protein VGB71_10595, partial [Flavisolibacter sp.]
MKTFVPKSRLLIICALLFLAVGYNNVCEAQVSIYTTNFGTTTSFPAGWTASSADWTNKTDVVSSGYTGASGGSNPQFLNNNITASTLTYSNSLSTIGYQNITLLWGARRTGTATITVTLSWSADGSTWNNVGFTNVANDAVWNLVNGGTRIALPAGAAGIANLRLRLSATASASGANTSYRIDDFTVQGSCAGISQLPTSNLISNYKFTGNAADDDGTNNGTLQNAPTLTSDRFNIANRAYFFNGSTQYVSTANSYVNPTNFTASIWFKTATASGGLLMGFGNAQTGLSANHDRKIYMNNAGQVYFGVYNGAAVTVNSALSYNDNNWHLVTATMSSTSGMVLYIDGAQVAANANTVCENITGYWRIGFENLNGWPSLPASNYFNGSLDDALVYHTALTSTQAATLYNSPDGAGNNGPLCIGSALSLTATTVSGATYAWTGPNGFTSSSQNPTLTYTAAYAGIYTVQVTSGSCTSTAYTNVKTAATSSTISYAGSPYCATAGTAAVTFSGTAGGTYSSTAGLTINATSGSVNLATSTAGTYLVTYAVAGGCTATATITIKATPAAPTATSPVNYCQNATPAQLTATGTNLLWGGGTVSGSGGGTAAVTGSSSYVDQYATNNRLTLFTTSTANVTVSSVDYYVTMWQTTTSLQLGIFNSSGTLLASSSTITSAPSVGTATKVTNVFNYTIAAAGSYSIGVVSGYGNIAGDSPTFPITESTGTISVTGATTGGASGLRCYNNIQFTKVGSSATAPTPSTTTIGTTNYQVTQTVSGCVSPASIIAVVVSATPTTANAGADQTGTATCGLTTITLAGNAPSSGTGAWTIVSGTGGTVTTPSSGTSTFTGTAGNSYTLRWTISTGCSSSTDDVIITLTAPAGTPTAITGTPPTCQLTNATTTTAFATTSTNSTGFNWSISNPAAGAINAATGVMTWANGFSGTVYIQVTASVCSGPSAQTIRTVTITPTVGTPTAITVGGGTEPTCQILNTTTTTTYFTSSTNSTSYNGSLSNPAAGTINMSTGVVTWAQGFYGSVNIQVTANGCNGPSAMTIRTVNIAQNPTTANAGPDETGATTCGLTTVTLAGNTPTVGTGAWSIISGTGGTVTTPSSPTSTFSGTAGSTYTLRWTISNGSCTSTDDVMITFNRTPTTSAAGPDQTSAGTCGLTTVTLAANAPSIGTGMWSIVSGTGGTITTPTSATSTFNGTAGTTYTLRWSISNNPCTASTDDVIISFNQAPTTSNAGPDQTVAATCGTPSVTLAANTPSVGIGAWTIVSGTGGTVNMPSSATSTFSGAHGITYTLRWTVSNSPCTASSDDVVITINQYTASADDQSLAGTNTWIGHMYDGINFSPYIGQFTEPETFNESFIGGATCFNVISNSITRSIYTETFSVKFRMNSTKRGLYVVNLGSDDGSRLTVDGTMVYNNWIAQSFTTKPSVLLNLNGASSLLYEFYENSGSNQVMFQNLTLVLANTISTNTAQSICIGNAGSAISGDVYGTLPTGLSLSGTGYQWSYSTTPGGVRTDIAGATGATFTPSAAIAPFNTAGTYYIYRNALVSSTNNIAPNPYVASNESNAATITVSAAPSATISYAGSPYCSSAGIASVTQTGTAGGTYTSTAGLTINASTGAITPGTSTAGTYTVTYTMAAIGGCSAQTATASVTINALPAATISYSGSPFCSNSGTGAVTLTGTAGGTYSSTTGLTINATTGVVTPGTSTVGTYTITYTMASGGCNAQTATTSVTITTLPSATIAYSGSPFCKSAGTAQPVTQSGTNGGVYSSTAGLSIDANTGEIVPATSVAGSYTVTYSIAAAGGCTAQTATASVTITPVPSAEFSYPGYPYSVAAGTASVAFSGTAGGTYSSTAGLALNATTGDVTLTTTSPGTYTVTYTAAAAGGCSVYTTTATITVVASTKIFTGTGNFSDPVRWTGGTLPTAGENLVIDGACTVDNSVTTDNIVYGTLTIGTATGRTLSWIAGGTNRLNVSDVSAGAVTSALNMTNGGTLIIRGAWSPINLTFTAGTGTIELQSTLTLPAPYTTYKNLTINGTGIIVKLGAATTVSGDLTITSGTLSSNNLGFSVKGNWINNVSTTAFTAGTSTVTFNGTTAQTIGGTSATTFTNLTIANTLTAVTLNVSTTITGNLSVTAKTFDLGVYTANRAAAGGTLTLSNNTLLKIGGTNTFPTNFTTNTLAVASTVEYYGTNQTVAAKTYGNLTLSSASGDAVKTFAATAFAIVGNLTSTVGAGTSVALSAAAALTITGNVTIGASTTFNGGGFTHSLAGNWVNNGTFNGNTGTITFSGPGKGVSGPGTQNFNNLSVSASLVTFSNESISLSGNLATISSGSFTQAAGGTLLMTGTGKTISGTGISIDNLTVSGTVTTAASFDLTGNLSVSGSMTASAGSITMNGT